jgi:hypothetical protein
MDSSDDTPLELGSTTSEPSAITSNSALPNAFGRMMQGGHSTAKSTHLRDRCKRPTPTYNDNYNPANAPPEDLATSYSPYVFGEPLFDDRPVITTRLPIAHIIAGASTRPRTSWVWALGYALKDTSKSPHAGIWACKHCMYFLNY